MDKKDLLHGLKEIADKMNQTIQDVERIKRNANDLKIDIEKMQLEIENFFNDFVKNE